MEIKFKIKKIFFNYRIHFTFNIFMMSNVEGGGEATSIDHFAAVLLR